MSADNNAGVQMRAMAQWVDNEVNPEQMQRAADPTMNPTVELHRNSYNSTVPSPSTGMYQTCATLE